MKELLKRAQRLLVDVQRAAEAIQSATEALAAATLTAKGTPRRDQARQQPRQLRPSVMVERYQLAIQQPPRKKPATDLQFRVAGSAVRHSGTPRSAELFTKPESAIVTVMPGETSIAPPEA